jgi:hypothetical protein
VGDGWTEKDEDSALWTVDTTEDARDVSRLMRNNLDATLAPELLDPFSLAASSSGIAFLLPLRSVLGLIFEDMDRVSRAGTLGRMVLLRFEGFDCPGINSWPSVW